MQTKTLVEVAMETRHPSMSSYPYITKGWDKLPSGIAKSYTKYYEFFSTKLRDTY